MRSLLFSFFFLVFFGVSTDVSASKKWVRVELSESSLNLKNYSHSDDCVVSQKYSNQYAYEFTVANCPRWLSNSEPRTYIRLSELQVGYVWGNGWHQDIRQTGIFRDFNRKPQWLKFFNKAEFDEGQKFNCLANRECAFRRLTFTIRTPEKNHQCQWVGFVPDLRIVERSEAPFKVEIATCETSVPITEEHIEIKPGKVTVTFPGGSSENGSAMVRPSISLMNKPLVDLCIGALSPDSRGWTEWNTSWKDEVLRRGLGIADCQQAMGVVPTTIKAKPPKEAEKNPKDNSSPNPTTSFGKSFAPKSLPPKSSNKADVVSQKPISNIRKRLEMLKKLEKNGLISSEEARKKREAILGEL